MSVKNKENIVKYKSILNSTKHSEKSTRKSVNLSKQYINSVMINLKVDESCSMDNTNI